MATTTEQPVKLEDVAGVRSRICWGAVVAGAVIAIAANMVITFFLMALGLTLTDAGVRANTVSTGALIAYLLGIIVSLFLGGWVTVQLTAGETDQESILYGILTWAVAVGFVLALMGAGMGAGYFALMRGAAVTQPAGQNWAEMARQQGASQAQIDAVRSSIDPSRQQALSPADADRAREAAVGASWAALVGLMLSMAACIGGSLAGKGPAFRLFPVARVETTGRRELIVS